MYIQRFMWYGIIAVNLNLQRGADQVTDSPLMGYSNTRGVLDMAKFWRCRWVPQMISVVRVWRRFPDYADAQSLRLCGFFCGRGDRSWASIINCWPVVTLQSNKVPVVQPSHAVHPLTPLITYSDEHFSPGSHPSHIPSDVNSKQGESSGLQGLFQLRRSHASSVWGTLQVPSLHVPAWTQIHL